MNLSIIIPAFNAEKTVRRAINSCLEQKTDFEFEVIIINDGSSDNTKKIISEFSADNRVRIISRENRGVGKTRSEGLMLAKGEYIIYLDADDFLHEGALDEVLKTAEKGDFDIVFFDSEYFYPDKPPKPYPALNSDGGIVSPNQYMLSMPSPWNKIMRKSLFEDLGIDFPSGIWYEDLATIPALSLSAEKDKIYYLKKTLHSYCFTEESITRGENFKEKTKDIIPAVNRLVSLTKGAFFPESEYLAWLHFYRTFAWTFLRFKKFDEIISMNKVFLSNFPKWYKNKYIIKSNIISVFYAFLFIKERFSILKFLKGRK